MPEKQNNVVLVDEKDNIVGEMEKNRAHHEGLLHRAVSVFIFNKNKEWLLQRRALEKYHSPGQWSNTCCTHPFPGESYINAAQRRLMEEMGLDVNLNEEFSFIYMANLDNNMVEHELDTVFFGYSDTTPNINRDEVYEYKYMSLENIKDEIKRFPENYTPWFKKLIDIIINNKGYENLC